MVPKICKVHHQLILYGKDLVGTKLENREDQKKIDDFV